MRRLSTFMVHAQIAREEINMTRHVLIDWRRRAGASVAIAALLWSLPAAAQTGMPSLSREAQRYTSVDPAAVLKAMRARIDRVTAANHCAAIPAQGLPALTNGHYYFLSEIGGCPALPCFLQQVPSTVHDYSTL